MLNIKPTVYAALVAGCPTADVSDLYPQSWEKMPKIMYTEEQNEVITWTDDEEKDARIVYRIDVWDEHNTSSLATQVDSAMSALGFLRTMSMDSPVPQALKHKIMRYEFNIAVDTLDVSH